MRGFGWDDIKILPFIATVSTTNHMKFKILILTFILTIGIPSFSFAQMIADDSYLSENHTHKIMFVVAMEAEAIPIIHTLNLHELTSFSNLPIIAYQGKYNNLDVFLVLNGKDPKYGVQNVGTQAAALATYLGIEYFHPDLVISVGTAGGIRKNGANINDVYVSEKIYFYDRRILGSRYHQYGLGAYPTVNIISSTNNLHLKLGNICSGDSFDVNKTDAQIIIQEDCSVVDMEAAGVAWVSMLMKTPMFAMKGITNYAEEKNGYQQFHGNFIKITNKLSRKVKEILEYNEINSLNGMGHFRT